MKPINREEMLRRLPGCFTEDDLSKFQSFLPTIAHRFISGAEWFDFGPVEYEALGRAAKDATPFRLGGYMRPPFQRCVFRARVPRTTGDKDCIDVDALLMICGSDGVAGTDIITELPLLANDVMVWSFVADATAMKLVDVRHTTAKPALPPLDEPPGFDEVTTETIYDALWLILNTRGVRKTIDVPDERLNRARIKIGKAPLQRVTRIDAAQYMRALAETVRMEGAGTHASPRMHLRRAHLRHYASERFREETRAKPIVIDAMIINADKDIGPPRDHYKVSHREVSHEQSR